MEFNFQTKIDIEEVERKLELTNLKMPSVVSQMEKAVNREVIKEARKNYKSSFNASNHGFRYGNLAISKGFKTNSFRHDKTKSYVKNTVFYSRFLENGAVIKPKGDNFLVFKINGQFKKVKSVRISAKPFLKPAVEAYWNTEKSNQIMEQVLQQKLNKYWNN